MMAPHAEQIVNGYLARLESELATAPADVRRELLGDWRLHIEEARARLVNETDTDLLNLLDRLGEPTELAREGRERLGLAPDAGTPPPAPARWGGRGWEIGITVGLLTIFWPAGVVALWTSKIWSTGDKLIGTLVPLAYVILVFALAGGHALFTLFFTLPLVALITALFVVRRQAGRAVRPGSTSRAQW